MFTYSMFIVIRYAYYKNKSLHIIANKVLKKYIVFTVQSRQPIKHLRDYLCKSDSSGFLFNFRSIQNIYTIIMHFRNKLLSLL